MNQDQKNLYEITKKVSFGVNEFTLNNSAQAIKKVTVDYEQLIEELERMVELTKNNMKFENYQSLFIYGQTGNAKSEIVKQVAENNGCIYHKLEIQKIPIEEFEGFPYLIEDEGKKYVRLANPTVLPKPDDENVWLLHLDEFNKADSDKMAAVMNLVLTGEIGGSADYNKETGKSEKYKLPKRTLIIGSGNFRTQENVENLNIVNQMDTATSERFHRAVHLDYNAKSWIKCFASKEYFFEMNDNVYTLSTRVPGILIHYIMEKINEGGNKAPFIIPISTKPDDGGSERTMSPRSWTIVGDNMILDGLMKFKGNELAMRKYGEISKKFYGTTERAFDMFMQDINNQIDLLAKQSFEFGLNGENIVHDIISRFLIFYNSRVTPIDIIFNYKDVRDKVDRIKNKIGTIAYLLIGVGYHLDNDNETDKDKVKKICLNISTFIEDVNAPAEDITAFISIVSNSKSKLAKEVHDFLYSISQRYKSAYGSYYYTSANEIK